MTNRHVRYSRHAEMRMQQRAISRPMVQMLLALGAQKEQRGDTTRVFLPKRARNTIRKELEEILKRYDSLQNSYLVLSENGDVITAGHLY